MDGGQAMTTDEMIEVTARAIREQDSWRNWKGESSFQNMARAALAAILPVLRDEAASSDWLWTDGYQWVRVDLIRTRFDDIAKKLEC